MCSRLVSADGDSGQVRVRARLRVTRMRSGAT